MTEIWLPVVGYEGLYEVSSEGRVRSLGKVLTDSLGRTRRIKPRILKRSYSHGYPSIGLHGPQRSCTRTVHILVMEAFIGPRPPGLNEIRHYPDPDKNNARLENLSYGTHSQNAFDRVEHGTHPMANKTRCKHGHPLTGDNVYFRAEGRQRHCRACAAIRSRKHKAARRAA